MRGATKTRLNSTGNAQIPFTNHRTLRKIPKTRFCWDKITNSYLAQKKKSPNFRKTIPRGWVKFDGVLPHHPFLLKKIELHFFFPRRHQARKIRILFWSTPLLLNPCLFLKIKFRILKSEIRLFVVFVRIISTLLCRTIKILKNGVDRPQKMEFYFGLHP